MKKKFKNILLILLVAMLALFTMAGCASYRKTKEELIEAEGYVASVCYYANGGKINEDSVRELYYKAGTKALEIGVVNPTSGKLALTRMNYTFGGWYFVQLDNDGNPVFEDETKTTPKLTDEKADFSVAMKDGDRWFVGAKWIADTKVFIQLVCEEGETLHVRETISGVTTEKDYKNGDVVRAIDYESDGIAKPPSALFNIPDKTHTFLAYYTDPECTQLSEGAWKKQEGDVTIYAKYITGEWKIVKTTSDLRSMFNNRSSGYKYWLFNDIDASSLQVTAVSYNAAAIGFDCEIRGNGYKISGLKVNKSNIGNGEYVSIFGAIGENAKFTDVTFENLKVTYNANGSNVALYFVFSDIADGAQITNVNISGTVTISKSNSTQIDNMYADDGYVYDNCLFGDGTNESYTDAEYVAASGGTGFIVAGNAQDFVIIN